MAAKFIENEILGTSRKCSKDEEKGGMSAGQNSGCERSGERRPDRIPDVRYPEKVERWPGQNSGCEISGWNVDGDFRLGGMSDATCCKGPSACPMERKPRGNF